MVSLSVALAFHPKSSGIEVEFGLLNYASYASEDAHRHGNGDANLLAVVHIIAQ